MTGPALLLALALVAAGETPPPAPAGPEATFPTDRVRAVEPGGYRIAFSHRVHCDDKLRTRCTDCHLLGEGGNRFLPAGVETCTPCHKNQELLRKYQAALAGRPPRPAPAGKVEPIHRLHVYYKCTRCHLNMTLSDQVGDMPLPPLVNTREVCVACHGHAVRFSHQRHIAVDGRIQADCSLCHKPQPDGVWYSTPGHPECWQCHDIMLIGLVEGCGLCHLEDTRAVKTWNLERASMLHHDHPAGKARCVDCHRSILAARSPEEAEAARRADARDTCLGCHKVPMAPGAAWRP